MISFIAEWSQIHDPSDPTVISVVVLSWLEKYSLRFQTKTTQRKHYCMLNNILFLYPHYRKKHQLTMKTWNYPFFYQSSLYYFLKLQLFLNFKKLGL